MLFVKHRKRYDAFIQKDIGTQWHYFVQNDSDCFKNYRKNLNLTLDSCKFLYVSNYDHEATNKKLFDEDEDKTFRFKFTL
jgi:hypothetical protein